MLKYYLNVFTQVKVKKYGLWHLVYLCKKVSYYYLF